MLKEKLLDHKTEWTDIDFDEFLHAETVKQAIKQKQYMTILRHIFTGMKVNFWFACAMLGTDDVDRMGQRCQTLCGYLDASVVSRGWRKRLDVI